MSKKQMIFWSLMVMMAITNNLHHPITPGFIGHLNLPNYIFGLSYSMMSLANFACSFTWAKWLDRYSFRQVFLMSFLIYAVGQVCFALSTTSWMLIGARLLAGVGASGFMVVGMMAVLEMAPSPLDQGTYLTLHTTIQTIAGMVGFFIGGRLGTHSFALTFGLQIALVLVVGLSFYIFFSYYPIRLKEEARPKSQKGLDRSAWIFCLNIVSLWLAVTIFDQSFNYLLNNHFNLQSDANGNFKVLVGLATLAVNSLVTMRLLKKGVKQPLLVGLSFLLFPLYLVLSQIQAGSSFFIMAVFLSTMNGMLTPIQSAFTPDLLGIVKGAGTYNGMRSLGMILGGLVAGFAYHHSVMLPFVCTALLMGLVGLSGLALRKK